MNKNGYWCTAFVLCLFGCHNGDKTWGNDWETEDTDTVPSLSQGTYANTTSSSLPGGEPTACEWEWTIRTLAYSPGTPFPRRMYFSSCNTDSEAPEMFASLTLGVNAPHPEEDPSSGGIVRTRLNQATGALEVIDSRHFPECLEMHGVATSSDCSVIAALCRIPSGTEGADADPLAEHPSADWMTQPVVCGDRGLNDEMWLYEWTDGNLQSAPKRYIVHKAIGSWEYGNNYLIYGESDDTYGIAVKATVFGGGICHEADAYLVLDRTNYSLTERAWTWACGTGHTTFNRPAYNPGSKKYAMMCSTDYNQGEVGGLGAVIFRLEDGAANEFHFVNVDGISNKGGASVLLPEGNDGFMGLFVGVDGEVKPEGYPLRPPTSIGLVHFGANSELLGSIRSVAHDDNAYLSYPQLVKLADDRYLLGWGVMHKLDGSDEQNGDSYHVPWEYWVMEVNAQGSPYSEPQKLEGTGWGDQDQMVNLG
ncbi:MAG: hypothetical protein MUC50_19030, partial [Myxococcota bacterium]|nr:hypothetical protein [Myxococcota bacterium]